MEIKTENKKSGRLQWLSVSCRTPDGCLALDSATHHQDIHPKPSRSRSKARPLLSPPTFLSCVCPTPAHSWVAHEVSKGIPFFLYSRSRKRKERYPFVCFFFFGYSGMIALSLRRDDDDLIQGKSLIGSILFICVTRHSDTHCSVCSFLRGIGRFQTPRSIWMRTGKEDPVYVIASGLPIFFFSSSRVTNMMVNAITFLRSTNQVLHSRGNCFGYKLQMHKATSSRGFSSYT